MFAKSARFYDAIYSFKDYPAEADLVHRLIQAENPDARSLLDVACGTGLHLEQLRRHYLVEGLDIDRDLLALARERNPGVTLHEGDMRGFDLGKSFDAVTCLFSSIGYATDVDQLGRAIASMSRHLAPGGILVVEGWLTPDAYEVGHLGSVFVDENDLKIARMDVTEREGPTSRLTFHYMVGTRDGISTFTEDHVLGLFSEDEYRGAFEAAGLSVRHDPDILMGRGVYVGVNPA